MFYHFFGLKKFDVGSIWTGKNSFANFFVFAKIFDSKDRKSDMRIIRKFSNF